MAKILLVDDEPSILSVLSTLLGAEGYDVKTVPGGDKAVDLLKNTDEAFELMISDIRMSPVNGMELLSMAREARPDMSVLMMTAYGSVETAVEALKVGAFDYITKPFKVDEMLITVERAIEYKRTVSENTDLKAQLVARYQFENIVAESPAMKHVCEVIERVAPTETAALISGEHGTGKSLVAHAIHAHSRRKEGTFVAINCSSLPQDLLESELFGHVEGAFPGASSPKEGVFEGGTGGTVYLSSIESMPMATQEKLLGVVREKSICRLGSSEAVAVDVRLLASTSVDLSAASAEGAFREDLHSRLSVIPIPIKPLRERRDDILPLVYHALLQEYGEGAELPSVDTGASEVMLGYDWPGNVRELENAIKHAVSCVKDGKLTKDCLPPKVQSAPPSARPAGGAAKGGGNAGEQYRGRSLKAFLRAKEREYLKQVLASAGGDKEAAARALKISPSTLYRKLSEDDSA